MNLATKLISVVLSGLLLVTLLCACAEKPKEEPKAKDPDKTQEQPAPEDPETEPEEPEETEPEQWTPENYQDVSRVDFSTPDIVIAADDYDGMFDFAKKLQNYEIPEGTIVEINGFVGASMMTHTVVVPNADGSERIGTTYEVVGGEVEYPEEGGAIHLTGVVRIGEYYPLLIVPAELFEAAETE